MLFIYEDTIGLLAYCLTMQLLFVITIFTSDIFQQNTCLLTYTLSYADIIR